MNTSKSLLFKSLLTALLLSACSVLIASDFEATKNAAEQGDSEA